MWTLQSLPRLLVPYSRPDSKMGEFFGSMIVFWPLFGATSNMTDSENAMEMLMPYRTFIFESAGGSSKRNARDPEEIIVFTVDCSYSMRQPSDFLEMQHVDSDIDEDEDSSSKEDSTDDENYDVDLRSISESPRGNTSLSFTQLKGSCRLMVYWVSSLIGRRHFYAT